MGQTVREFNFGAGNPAPEVFPAEALGAAAQRVIARSGRELAHYPDQRGEPELRAIAVERMARVHGLRPSIDDVVITNGSMQGLSLSAQALAQRGDAVAVEEFCYGGTIRVFKRYGLELLGVALDDDGMRMDALAELLERQQAKGRLPAFIYTTASYQNPTGTTQPRARRLELLALARRYHVPVVEDDTYADISFEPLTEPAIYSLADPGEVVYLSSFSKILGPGLRLGYFIAPEPLRSRLLEWKIDGGTSGLSQRIVAEYLGAELWPHVEEGRQTVKAKRNALLDALETETSDLHLRWTRPEGGLFVWIELPPEVDRARLRQLAADRHIVYATGQAFDADGEDVAYLRLAFGWIAETDIADGVRALVECIREAMPATAAARAS
jgi:2-aminoadipate transaminase